MEDQKQADQTAAEGHSLYPGYKKRMILVRRRKRRPFLQRRILNPLEEIIRSLLSVARSHPIPIVLLSTVALWWFWPSLRPSPNPTSLTASSIPRVITVFVEDPQRTIAAFELRESQPGSVLILQGRPSSQVENREYLETQGKWPSDMAGVMTLTEGCDTVGQLTNLAKWTETLPEAGILTVVTSPAHLPRSMAIARILLEPKGWTILGTSVETGDNRPESKWRLIRDELRAHLWRATGWDGTDDLHCQRVEESSGQGSDSGEEPF